jgi:hypothetical protein
MLFISIQELEAAINYWRSQAPAQGEEAQLSKEASSLAKPYALMIIQGSQRMPMEMMEEAARSALASYLEAQKNSSNSN